MKMMNVSMLKINPDLNIRNFTVFYSFKNHMEVSDYNVTLRAKQAMFIFKESLFELSCQK